MNNTNDFAGKVALVTGTAHGIGRVAALAFARRGAAVAVLDVAKAANQETARQVEEAGARALAITYDVSRGGNVLLAVEQTVAAFGGLDFAFNNAGIEQPIKPLTKISDEEWRRLMQVNLDSVFFFMRHEIESMLEPGRRRHREHLLRDGSEGV